MFDIGNGKWSFGNWRGENIAWSDNLVKLYSFGRDDNSFEGDLNLQALRGVISAKISDAAINKAMGK
jgi:hypothetical protein